MLLHKSVVHDSRVRREASALADAGHHVSVVELDREAKGTLDGFRRLSGAPPNWIKRVLPRQLYRCIFLGAFVGRVLRLRPEVVHAHDAAMLLPGVIGARLTGAKLVYDSHELATGVPYRDGSWARFVATIERLVVPRADAVITVSDGIAARLEHDYRLRRRPTVVRNITDLRPPPMPTGALRKRLGIGDSPLILHQGAPAPDRGAEELIRAMTAVPDAHLVFLGSSPFDGFEERLRGLAERGEIAARVHFLPSVPLDELLEWTADADVGISLLQDTCDNHRLALPNKLFEYMAAGVPVVVSDLPEVAELVQSRGVGLVVPPSRPEAIAAGIHEVIAYGKAPELRTRIANAAAELSWPRERYRLTTVYDELTSPRPDRALVFVRNAVTHDARVLREVDTLARAGWEPVVLGVVSGDVTDPRGRAGGAPLLRLDPRSPFRRIRERSRRRPSAPSHGDADGPATTQSAAPSTAGRAVRALHRTLTTADFYRQGVGAVRALRPGLVHCNDWNTMWIGVTAKAVWKVPLVYDCHELWADRNGRPEPRAWLVAAESLFVRMADEVITTSPGYSDELARRYRIATPTLVRNLPTVSTRGGPPRNGDPPRVVYVGGLLRGRGLEQAIEALVHLPGVHLTLIGPGQLNYRQELTALADVLGVGAQLELRGAVSPAAVVTALVGADVGLCLIQPICRSYELTLPNKLFEYAAAGVPLLASDLPVIAATVREWDAGEVVPPSDPSAIAEGMRRLLNPERSARVRAGARAMAHASRWEDEREVLLGVYRRASEE